MDNKITDVGSRALKTFFQAFISFLLVQVIEILTQISHGSFDWGNLKSWAMTVGVPIIAGAIAAGLSALQNSIINKKNSSSK